MDMREIVIKSEGTQGSDILLFYIDENGTEQSLVTSVENVSGHPQVIQDGSVIIDAVHSVEAGQIELAQSYEQDNGNSLMFDNQYNIKDRWTDSDTERLLVFYNDNKETFVKGLTKKKHLWSVACKTMLLGKNPTACEMKLRNIKRKYVQMCIEQKKGHVANTWPFFNLCHQLFHDDAFVNATLSSQISVPCYEEATTVQMELEETSQVQNEEMFLVKNSDNDNIVVGDKSYKMLQLYLNHKNSNKNVSKEIWQRGLWQVIATEMGEEDSEYWKKKFRNYKQHYIRILDKRAINGADSVHWPYMTYFDEIYKDDEEFNLKYLPLQTIKATPLDNDAATKPFQVTDWDVTEMTVLVKYYFDCFHEFQDPTIPDLFLWSEVGRLLDRSPEQCKSKYEHMKLIHLSSFNNDAYDIKARVPLDILYDNIIAKEVELELDNEAYKQTDDWNDIWKSEQVDELIQFMFAHVDMLKDPICYFVCWAQVAQKLGKSIISCKKQWDECKSLYISILENKKDNPDLEIDWRYIELFDRIFDYGMNQTLLNGFDSSKVVNNGEKQMVDNKGSKKHNIYDSESDQEVNGTSDNDSEDGNLLKVRHKGRERKAFKILEFYKKNKDMFSKTNRNKSSSWEAVAKQVNMTPTQCAHRFRNLKQVYMAYLHRECKCPEKPIVWPYYALCKKVFGYRALKAKIIKKKFDNDFEYREWAPKEIKALIKFYKDNFHTVNKNLNNNDCWTPLAGKIGKSENLCKEKFMELRKSYRKLKTMLTRNPATKVSWKYYSMFDAICSEAEEEQTMELEYGGKSDVKTEQIIKNENKEDEEIQFIIVVPEGQTIEEAITTGQYSKIHNIDEATSTVTKPVTKWTKKTRKRLLLLYFNYLKAHKDQEINTFEMWKEIATKLENKSVLSCKKMLTKLKRKRIEIDNIDEVKKKTPYYAILEKILALNPKFSKKINIDGSLKKKSRAKDVPLLKEKVKTILEFYLENLEEFLSPRYEKKAVWTELANKVDEPMSKVYNKIMFLKNIYNKKESEPSNEIPFVNILEKIQEKQKDLKEKITLDKQLVPKESRDYDMLDNVWSNEDTEKLLLWYLAHLDKFKNPKYVRSFLWQEASEILLKSPVACSKKMAEIRTEYRNKVRESPDDLKLWKFFELCQKIYGTGKKNDLSNNSIFSEESILG